MSRISWVKREPASSGPASSGGASRCWTVTQLLRAIRTVTPLSPALVSPSPHLLEAPGCQHPSSPAAAAGSILPRPCSSPAPYLAVVLPWAALLLFCWRAMPPGSTPLGSGGSCGMSAGGFQRCGPVSTEGIQEALSSFVRCFAAYLDRRRRGAGCGELASHRVVVLGY